MCMNHPIYWKRYSLLFFSSYRIWEKFEEICYFRCRSSPLKNKVIDIIYWKILPKPYLLQCLPWKFPKPRKYPKKIHCVYTLSSNCLRWCQSETVYLKSIIFNLVILEINFKVYFKKSIFRNMEDKKIYTDKLMKLTVHFLSFLLIYLVIFYLFIDLFIYLST